MKKTICENCKYRRNVWSEQLQKEYDGCIILNIEHFNVKNDNDIKNNIIAEQLGSGWIKSGIMSYNNQLITKNTKKCKFKDV